MRDGLQSRTKWLVAATAALAVVAGGLALGSNMGFKFNAALTAKGVGQVGNNWLSVPDNNPYTKANLVCTQLGLTAAGPNTARGVVSRLNAPTGVLQNYTCGTSTFFAFALTKGEAIKIADPTPPASAIVVGSDDPNNLISLTPKGIGEVGNNWVSLVYHTTAIKANDICTDAGLTATGPNTARGVVSRLNAPTGVLQNYTCGTSTFFAFTLTIGEGIKVTDPTPPGGGWLMSHF